MATLGIRPLTRFNSHQHVFRAYDNVQHARGVRRSKQQQILSREDYITNPPDVQRATTGEERLREFEELLENGFGIERGDFQREFHAQVTKEVAENIVGPEDWAKIGEKLKRARGWRIIRQRLMASAPRRFGKSVALAQIVAAYAVIVPASVQCIFSTGRRASKNDLEIIYKLICDLGHKDWIVKFNDEELWLRPDRDAPTDVRKIFSYPSKATISTTPHRTAPHDRGKRSTRRRRRRRRRLWRCCHHAHTHTAAAAAATDLHTRIRFAGFFTAVTAAAAASSSSSSAADGVFRTRWPSRQCSRTGFK